MCGFGQGGILGAAQTLRQVDHVVHLLVVLAASCVDAVLLGTRPRPRHLHPLGVARPQSRRTPVGQGGERLLQQTQTIQIETESVAAMLDAPPSCSLPWLKWMVYRSTMALANADAFMPGLAVSALRNAS